MKVGEVTFYYDKHPSITCLYVTETQRLAFINEYKPGAKYYTIIPYVGAGMPNMVNTTRKWYAIDKAAAAGLHGRYTANFRGKLAKEWYNLADLNQLNIKAA